ncbi:hypothetical protein CLOM_g19430 [Closterium sp. NIES-68]|nr:hypothetical protein CLOM_g19430 [Closterium sp. NIES-68]
MGTPPPRGRSARGSAGRRSAMMPATGARKYPLRSPSAHLPRNRSSAPAASTAPPFTSLLFTSLLSSLLFTALLAPAAAQVADTTSPGCTVSASAVSCPAGFTGGAFALNAQAYVAGAGRGNALVLGAGGSANAGSAGSAFSSAALALPLSGDSASASASLSFSARFTFELVGVNEADVATGLAFVITSGPTTAVGSPSLFGYGGADFKASLAVVLSGQPPISAGLLAGGRAGGTGRWAALNPSSPDAPHLLAPGVLQHAWVDFDASLSTLRLFLSGSSPTKPAAPVLSEPVDLAWALGLAADGSCGAEGGGGCLFVGFTGGSAAVDAAEAAAAGIASAVDDGGGLMQIVHSFDFKFLANSAASSAAAAAAAAAADVGATADSTSTESRLAGLAEPAGLGSPNVFLASDDSSGATVASYGALDPSAAGGGLFTTASLVGDIGTAVGTATTLGTAAAPAPAPATSALSSAPCNVTATSISCVGFSSSSSPALSSPFFQLNGDAQVGPGPNFPIWLDTTTNAAGCALSIPSLSLSLGTGPGGSTGAEAVAFEAAFSFSFAASADYNSWGNRGLAFVITAGEKTACGRSSGSAIGYGFAPNNSFAQSIAVEMRSRPSACVAVVVGGEVAGDNCADSDAMALLPPAQAFTLNEPQYVWVSYDGSTRALQVFVSPGSPSKPQSAALVVPLDVPALLGGTSGISVGFTGGSWWTWVDDLEDHVIHSLSFEAVPPGSQQSLPPSSPPSTCHLAPSHTRLTCTGFAGRSPFRLNGYAHVGPAPNFPLVLDTGGTAGSALTLADLVLSLDSTTSAAAVVAFEAAFSFSVLTETSYGYRGSRGLAFVVSNGEKTACGSSDMGAIGYGGAAPGAFNGSVAVELRSGPTSCVALVVNGKASGDNCAAADQMTGLTGDKAFTLNERQHAWVAYDSSSQSLEVYLGGSDGVKPEEPVLRTALDLVAVIGATSASVGFTAGTWWWGCGDTDDHHLIHSFTFNTVSPGFLPSVQPTQAPTCRATESSLHCAGFAGSAPFDLNGYAQLGPAPLFPLWLDSYDTVGSALSLSPLSLLTPSGLSTAFEAAFSFTFLADACVPLPVTGRGFTFVLTSGPATALGPQNASSLGYGSAGGAFLNSVAVEFRLCPVPCIAVSSKGVVAGDGCAGAEFFSALPPEQGFPLNTKQHAWVSYEGASQTLKVFLGGASKVKPAVPVLTAHVDIPTILGATSASVGFTAGTWWWQDMANERHIVHELNFVGGTFLEMSNITAELTSTFAYSNETVLSTFTTATTATTAPTTTTATTKGDITTATTMDVGFTSTGTSGIGTSSGAVELAALSPDATRGTVEFRFVANTVSGPHTFTGQRRIVASRPVVRAHVYISNMEESAMAGVAVTTRITYPNGTDASHCFVFSDPVLDGIADVNGAGTLASKSSASVDWLLLALDCAAPAAPTNFKFGSDLQYTLPDTSASSAAAGDATSAPPPVVKQVNLTSVRVTVAPPPKLQVHYFVPKHVQGDDLDTPQVEAPVPVVLGALFYNSGHGTAAAVATQSLPAPATTATTTVPGTTTSGAGAGAPAADVGATTAGAPTADTGATTAVAAAPTASASGALTSFSITKTVLGDQAQPPSFSVQIGSIPPSGTAMVRWTIEASLTGTFDTVTTNSSSSSLVAGLSPILESVDIHNLVHVVYLLDPPSGAGDDGLPDFLVDDDGDAQGLPDAIYSSAANRVLPVTAVPHSALTLGRPLFTGETRAKLTVTVDWSSLTAAAGGWSYLAFASLLPSHCWNLTAALRSNGSQLPVPFNAWTSFSSSHSPSSPATGTAPAPAPASSLASSPSASPSADSTHILDLSSSPSFTLFYSYFDQTLSFPHLPPCYQAVMPPPPSPPNPPPSPPPRPPPRPPPNPPRPPPNPSPPPRPPPNPPKPPPPPSPPPRPPHLPPDPPTTYSPSPPPSKPPQAPVASPSPSSQSSEAPSSPLTPPSPPPQPAKAPPAPLASPATSPQSPPKPPSPPPPNPPPRPPPNPPPNPLPQGPRLLPLALHLAPPKSPTSAASPQASFSPSPPSPPPSPKPAQGRLSATFSGPTRVHRDAEPAREMARTVNRFFKHFPTRQMLAKNCECFRMPRGVLRHLGSWVGHMDDDGTHSFLRHLNLLPYLCNSCKHWSFARASPLSSRLVHWFP